MERIVGVDENGLGPRLGPLVATAATIEVARYDAEKLREVGDTLGIGDSKRHSAFGKMKHAEGLALALATPKGGKPPTDADDLLAALSLDGILALRSPCPDPITARPCWETRLPLPAFGGDVETGRALLAELKGAGVKLRRVRTTLACAGVLNAWLASGRTKLTLDLHLFERLILDARGATRGPVHAICGMVGGLRRYAPHLGGLGAVSIVEEVKGASRYEVPKLGRVDFEVKSDDRHLPVGLASMVGKYVREVAMARLVGWYRAQDDSLPAASGYHDPVTRSFVEGTAALRKKLPVADACFERRG
ncbi:MAG: hypothetical protein H6724_04270 [Sandaracinus sp.]|nr:hypothetical protein [Sandaracinus sp.]